MISREAGIDPVAVTQRTAATQAARIAMPFRCLIAMISQSTSPNQ